VLGAAARLASSTAVLPHADGLAAWRDRETARQAAAAAWAAGLAGVSCRGGPCQQPGSRHRATTRQATVAAQAAGLTSVSCRGRRRATERIALIQGIA